MGLKMKFDVERRIFFHKVYLCIIIQAVSVAKPFYLRGFSEIRSCSGSTSSVHQQHFWGAPFVQSVTPNVFIPFHSIFA